MAKMLKLKAPKFKKIDDDVLPSLYMEEGRTILGKSHKIVHRENDKGRKLEKYTMVTIRDFSLVGKTRKDRKRRVDRFLDKVDVLQSLRHANIVRTLALPFRGDQYRALLTQFLPFPLHEYLEDMRGDERQSCVTQLTEALYYLHTRRIVHGDLKLANVVTDGSKVFKLCGLGSAQLLPWESDVPKRWTSPRGEYRAPELDDLSLELNAFKMESYSFGVLSCCILLGNKRTHARGQILKTVKSSSQLQPLYRECLTLLLDTSPSKRAAIYQIRDLMKPNSGDARLRPILLKCIAYLYYGERDLSPLTSASSASSPSHTETTDPPSKYSAGSGLRLLQ